MRRYLYDPDEAWITKRFAFHRKGLDDVRRTVETSARAKGRVAFYDTAIAAAWEAVRHGWALEEPVDVLQGWLEEAAGWIAEARAAGRDPGFSVATRWLSIATLAGGAGAAAVASLTPSLAAGGGGGDDVDPLTRHLGHALAAFAVDDLAAAAAAGEAIAAATDDPTVPLPVLDALSGLDRVVLASAAGDGAALAAALADRSADNAARFGESVEARRHGEGLVDLYATAIAVQAHRRGVSVEAATADIALGLAVPARA